MDLKRFIPKTLFWQLVLGTTLIQSVLLGLFIWHTVVSQRQQAQARIRTRLGEQVVQLADPMGRNFVRGDMDGVREILELSRLSSALDLARLTDLQGRTLAITGNGASQELDADERRVLAGLKGPLVFDTSNGQAEAVSPIPMDGPRRAILWLEPNRALFASNAKIAVQVSMAYGGFALLANLLPIFLIVQGVTRPLRRLRDATRRLAANPDMRSGFPLPVTRSREAGDLTRSFNTMVREVEDKRNGLMETVALLDSMLEHAPIGMAFLDRDFRVVRVNQHLADAVGLAPGEVLGDGPADTNPHGAVFAEMRQRVAEVFASGESVHNVELSLRSGDGFGGKRTWLMQVYAVRIEPTRVRWVGLIAVEITDRIRGDEALRKTEKLAATGRLAASIAHEINNPLESVTNLLYLLETHADVPQEARSLVITAQGELARVAEITQQTLRFYRQSTRATETDLAEVLQSVLTLYHARTVSAQVEVRTRFGVETVVFGFGGEIRQVFANLVGNALDAMPHGGCLHVRVRRSRAWSGSDSAAAGVRVTVADTGTGMSPEVQARIFEAFFSTKPATGTGLGLWVSEEILRKHGAAVRIRSRTTEQASGRSGSVFCLFFPQDGVAPGERPAEREATAGAVA